jgi:RimJ/RimL family protein N-acetyltransferase
LIRETERLLLIAGTLPLIEAELQNPVRFAELLGARVPANWPPPLNDPSTLEWCRRYLKKHPDGIGWVNWYFILRQNLTSEPMAIGNGGFRGKPDGDGVTEVGYSILEQFQNAGYATEALSGLLQWVFSHSRTDRIIAQTYSSLTRSIRVLEKTGFIFAGPGTTAGMIRYELMRNRLKQ